MPYLTKHPLVFSSAELDFYHHHHISGARIADFSGVLLHYKYVGDFVAAFRRAVEEGSYWENSVEYRGYLTSFQADRRLGLHSNHARRLSEIEQLLEEGFVCASRRFRAFADYEKLSETQ